MVSVANPVRSWTLLRTKAGAERRAHYHVSRMTREVFLPLAKTRIRRWSHYVDSVVPLFPCYLFARLDGDVESRRLRYTAGLQGCVRVGGEPAVVPDAIIAELQRRCDRGPVELPQTVLAQGQAVRVVDGPFRHFEGIFERYYTGTERVAILLCAISGSARIIVRKASVAPSDAD
jgi:transcriptional antiterminator RfaH